MDGSRFDQVVRSLTISGTRRSLIALLVSLPPFGGLAALLGEDEAEARRKRRKKRNKHGKGRRKGNRQKKCKPNSLAKSCAGKCGSVKNNCKKTVDCGSCACIPPCPVCKVCQETPDVPGTCVADASQVGDDCGAAGQVCHADGSCGPACGAGGACLAFLTAAGFTGDLGGLNGADAKCQAEAQAAGLSGTYMAWLSTDAQSPSTRFTQSTGPYQRVDGATVAADWSALTSGTLEKAIDLTATGEQNVNEFVWTFTHIDGTPARDTDGDDCNGWITDAQEGTGSVGISSGLDSIWTLFDPDDPPACDGEVTGLPRLYCFQQTS